jgi:hypothetical protein
MTISAKTSETIHPHYPECCYTKCRYAKSDSTRKSFYDMWLCDQMLFGFQKRPTAELLTFYGRNINVASIKVYVIFNDF